MATGIDKLTDAVRDALSVQRVFGEPIERDGVTVIPAAIVRGGGGGGGDHSTDEGGSGAGFGLGAKPAGAYVIKDGQVAWHPALDLNRVILVSQAVGLVLILTVRGVLKRRAKG
jgi:uncharacterized spore protein YtfJ